MRKKIFYIIAACAIQNLSAHDHMEVGVDPDDESRFGFSGPTFQLALYVPRGEPFSGYLPQFPGGYYASELTFNAEGNSIEFAAGSQPRVEIVSVAGPAGGGFSFWEVGATSPTWTLTSGWAEEPADRPSFAVYEDGSGYGHLHGRAFTFDKPGVYEIAFRAIDEATLLSPSLNKSVTFNAQPPPRLAIRLQNDQLRLSFQSRQNLTYDLQVSTTLEWDSWTTIDWVDGNGQTLHFQDPIMNRSRAFYRLVEYR